jgi:CHAT domain-containing protein/tetratricopeptide (TPR) repeat protein
MAVGELVLSKPIMLDELSDSVEAFLEGRYTDCIYTLSALPKLSYFGSQLLLISLMRSENIDLARAMANRMLDELQRDSLSARLVLISVCQIAVDPRELHSLVKSPEEESQVHYYLAEWLRTTQTQDELDGPAFRGAFLAAATTHTDTPECKLAERICVLLGEEGNLALYRIERSVNAAQESIEHGRSCEAIQFLTRALAIARAIPTLDPLVEGSIELRLGVQLEQIWEFAEAISHLGRSREIALDRMAPRPAELAVLESAIGRSHLKLKHYDEALDHFHSALSAWSQLKGPDSKDAIIALDEIAFTYELRGDFEEARQRLESVVALKTRKFGGKDERTLESVETLSHIHRILRGNRTPRPDWDVTLDALVERFKSFMSVSDRGAAEKIISHIKLLGLEIPPAQRMEGLRVLADFYNASAHQGEVRIAFSCAQASAEVASSFLAPTEPLCIKIAGNLAEAYRSVGDYEQAIRQNEAVLDLRRRVLGAKHPDVALSLNNLAAAHLSRGNPSKALELLESALEIDYEGFGELHEATAGDLQNIGDALNVLGDWPKARERWWQAVRILENLYPEGHVNLATALEQLGHQYLSLGDLASAEEYLKRARDMYRRTAAGSHPGIVRTTASIARLSAHPEEESNNVDNGLVEAEQLLGANNPELTKLKIQSLVGADNPKKRNLLDSLYNSAQAQLGQMSEYTSGLEEKRIDQSAACGELVSAKAGLENLIELDSGRENPSKELATRLTWKLASIEAALGEFELALVHTREAVRLLGAWRRSLPFGSESESSPIVSMGITLIDHCLTLLTDHLKDSRDAALVAIECVVQYKNMSSSLIEKERAATRASSDPDVRDASSDLRRLRAKIINELTVGPGSRGAMFAISDIKEWQVQYRRASDRLAACLAKLIPREPVPSSLLDAITTKLPCDSVLLEFVCFAPRDFSDLRMGRGGLVGRIIRDIGRPDRVLAFVVQSSREADLSWAVCGTLNDLTILLDDLNCFLRPTPTAPKAEFRDVAKLPVPNSWEEASKALGSAVLNPIAEIWKYRRLFIAPDGVLANLSFEVLPDIEGATILDHRHVSYITSARDLLNFDECEGQVTTEPIVFADPDFDCTDATRPISSETLGGFWSAICSASVERHLAYYASLSGTRQEGEDVAQMLGARLFMREEANKTRFFSLQSPTILHLATHAFYPDRPGAEWLGPLSFDWSMSPELTKESGIGLQSGLVLAGASWKCLLSENLSSLGTILSKEGYTGPDKIAVSGPSRLSNLRALRDAIFEHKPFPAQKRIAEIDRLRPPIGLAISWILEDSESQGRARAAKAFLPPEACGGGLVTADEVAWLDLNGTELVVLSACGTGLGIGDRGGDLVGLRQSFFIAGARRRICSLWSIPDRQTALLIHEFYAALIGGNSTIEALRTARLKLKEIYPREPYYWAGFVLYGRQDAFSFPRHLDRRPSTESADGAETESAKLYAKNGRGRIVPRP